jgi:hypothetical protein
MPHELLVTANLADDVAEALRQRAVQRPVTVIDSGGVTAGLIDALRRRDWDVTAEPARPTHADVVWRVPDEFDDDDLVVGLRVEHDAAGLYTVRDFGTDAAALCTYIADLPSLQRVKVRLEPMHPALAEATALMTAAELPWRRDRRNDKADLDGTRVTRADISLQLVIDGYGWMSVRFDLDDQRVVGRLSYLRDSWTDLVATVAHVAAGLGPAYCAFIEEPDCKHVIVSRDGDRARLEIYHVKDKLYGDPLHPRTGVLAGMWSGAFADLVEVVVGSSNGLIDAAGIDGIHDRWSMSPPLAQLADLERWLVDNSRSS